MALIDFEGVDLVYPVRENRGLTLKDLLLKGVFRRRQSAPRWKSIHALKEVTFRIGDGERVGIIGRNGAGKSTLLRSIGGVFPVHKGRRQVDGNICALFDIGLGFEPLASGWENIRFRGYLQGETPRSIQAKVADIAEFTELGQFLDLPLNCYSTGMVMRLAFAIATSGHPEILLVDEVFAAGDLSFQQKAQARMREFMGRARIVVMVGHNLDFLQQFSTRMLWLDQGCIRADGPPNEVVAQYRDESNAVRAAA
jgi:ABC-type polysaccharide/polyol phosphate transport system ATPase subunit